MSLQVALKQVMDDLGKVITSARELGPKITDLEAKNDPTAKEENEKFAKMVVDIDRLSKRKQQLESTIAAEAALTATSTTVVNPVVAGNPAEAQRMGPLTRERMSEIAPIQREFLNAYVRFGERSEAYRTTYLKLSEKTTPEERHALLGTVGNLGGVLVNEDFRAEVVKNMAGYAVARASGMRIVPTSSSTLVYPSIAGGTDPWSTGFSGAWRAEGSQGTDGSAPVTQDQPTFGREAIPVHVWQPAAVVLTREFLEDAVIPVDSILAQTIAETKSLDEDYAFFRGTGQGQPRGVLDYVNTAAVGTVTNGFVTLIKSGDAGLLKYDGLVDLIMNLPAQYRENAVFYMRSTTFGAILKLKDSTQLPILYGTTLPNSLFGKKVFVTEHMPAVAGSANPVLFGDPRFYIIAERTDLRLQRLEERFAPNIGILPTARLGGGLVRPQAFVAQNISA